MDQTNLIPEKKSVGVPEPTVRRLPAYLSRLRTIKEEAIRYVSAPQLARDLSLDPTQVTKDLSYTGVSGKTKVGYEIDSLISGIEDFLGYNRKHEAFLVGAGHLGSALIQYQGFREAGLRIVAAFDTDKRKVGQEVGGVMVFHLEKLRDLASRLHITIGIITTPPSAAQNIADLMVGWGIKAIWNFAPVSIKVPDHIILQDTHLYANLAVLLNKLDTNK